MPYILKKYYPTRNLVFVFGEGLLIFLIINAVFISWMGLAVYSEFLFPFFLRALVVTFIFQICFYFFDLYEHSVIPRFADHLLKVLQTFGVGCILLAFIYFLFPYLIISNEVFWTGLAAIGLTIIFWRLSYFWALEKRLFTQPIALIGTGKSAAQIAAAIEGKQDAGFKIAAFVKGGNSEVTIDRKGVPLFSEIKELRRLCETRTIEKIVLALDEKRGMLPMHELIGYKFMGIEILDAVRFYEELTGKIMVENVNPSWLLFSEGFYVGRGRRVLKRGLDLLIGSTVFIISLPVFIVSAAVIKLESPGRVFYIQERVGEHGRLFKVLKFRSMREDAEKDGPVWAATDDDRVTRYGR
ncbi:MAG: sugar transferase, partial [Desulfosalsimonadaceae bacterium]